MTRTEDVGLLRSDLPIIFKGSELLFNIGHFRRTFQCGIVLVLLIMMQTFIKLWVALLAQLGVKSSLFPVVI